MTLPAGGAPPSGQLALGVGFNAARRLDNFVPGANAPVVQALRAVASGAGGGHVFLRGADATGKTHLLQACCAHAQERGARVAYLPLANRAELPRGLLAGMAEVRLVCVDDVDQIAGDAGWETAVFNLYNEADASGARLLFSGHAGPSSMALPDLQSRLAACLVLVLAQADDGVRRQVLCRRAQDLGFDLGEDVADFILARQPRDLARLASLVEALDGYALAAKRRVTIALVREFLAARGA